MHGDHDRADRDDRRACSAPSFGIAPRPASGDADRAPRDDAETQRLREEVKQLKERLAVLERITVEKENSLEREIERLRDQ